MLVDGEAIASTVHLSGDTLHGLVGGRGSLIVSIYLRRPVAATKTVTDAFWPDARARGGSFVGTGDAFKRVTGSQLLKR